MSDSRLKQDPAALRGIFGRNLRELSKKYTSVAALCRELKINRTQFNRYLSGESFPRPDILHHICLFFNVDARILLEPVKDHQPAESDLLNHPYLEGYFGPKLITVTEKTFPSGFYRCIRRSFIDDSQFVSGLIFVARKGAYTFLRGYESRNALGVQGLSLPPQTREFRGLIMRQKEGVIAFISHQNSLSCSFNFLTPKTAFEPKLWEGYVTRTAREKAPDRRATRMVYEHLGNNWAAIMKIARSTGLIQLEDVPPFYAPYLKVSKEFR